MLHLNRFTILHLTVHSTVQCNACTCVGGEASASSLGPAHSLPQSAATVLLEEGTNAMRKTNPLEIRSLTTFRFRSEEGRCNQSYDQQTVTTTTATTFLAQARKGRMCAPPHDPRAVPRGRHDDVKADSYACTDIIATTTAATAAATVTVTVSIIQLYTQE